MSLYFQGEFSFFTNFVESDSGSDRNKTASVGSNFQGSLSCGKVRSVGVGANSVNGRGGEKEDKQPLSTQVGAGSWGWVGS